ncbi:MAG TPA: outer membrane lipoprotein carrier protein LolA [Burkholderiales bacterium]|nr:outer membrane lipoprotein carrier protein LolA [Burkholderiales bacterium]
MTTGTRILAEGAAAVLAAGLLSVAVAAPRLDASRLMQTLAGVRSASASFVETRYSPLLKSPLVSHGTLSYRRPDRLEKIVVSPHQERIALHGDRLTIDSPPAGRREISLDAGTSGIATLIEAVRATRAGDLARLERDFDVVVSGTLDDWQLRLKPRAADVGQYVSAVGVWGSGPRLQRVEVWEASGDRTVMEIDEATD